MMSRKSMLSYQWFGAVCLVLLSCLSFSSMNAAEITSDENASVEELNFQVFLDDREVGFHNFRVEQVADTQTIDIDANFKITLLKVPIYRYQHTNREVWRNGCLQSIRSSTDANGEQFNVDGAGDAAEFTVNTAEKSDVLDDSCIMTFAYWSKDFLDQQKLLNSQNGEWLTVEIDFIGVEEIDVGSGKVAAKKYRIRDVDSELDIAVWYEDTTDRWLSLESRVKGDRLLRYFPIPANTDASP